MTDVTRQTWLRCLAEEFVRPEREEAERRLFHGGMVAALFIARAHPELMMAAIEDFLETHNEYLMESTLIPLVARRFAEAHPLERMTAVPA